MILSRMLRTWGVSESALAELLAAGSTPSTPSGNPTIAFLASGIEGIKVRITAKAATPAGGGGRCSTPRRPSCGPCSATRRLRRRRRDHGARRGRLLVARGLTLGVAESLTGGLVGARLTDVAGASEWFRGSIVAYASEVKFDLLGVPDGPGRQRGGRRGDGRRRAPGPAAPTSACRDRRGRAHGPGRPARAPSFSASRWATRWIPPSCACRATAPGSASSA